MHMPCKCDHDLGHSPHSPLTKMRWSRSLQSSETLMWAGME
jgi:hypothetical protein